VRNVGFAGVVPAFFVFGIYRLWLAAIEFFPETFYYAQVDLPQELESVEQTFQELHPKSRPVSNLVFGLL
jgi:hypothetical protein